MYGAQTEDMPPVARDMFENDVEMYGAQTRREFIARKIQFENDVEMYGAQTAIASAIHAGIV